MKDVFDKKCECIKQWFKHMTSNKVTQEIMMRVFTILFFKLDACVFILRYEQSYLVRV